MQTAVCRQHLQASCPTATRRAQTPFPSSRQPHPQCRVSFARQHASCPSARQRRPAPLRAAGSSEFDVDAGLQEEPTVYADLGPRDDEVLPDSLQAAIQEAAEATAEAVQRGNTRCQVEILMPEFWDPISGPQFPNRGDQERFWRMTRRFMEHLATTLKSQNIRAVYPDAGVAAMLTHQWQDATFQISSLNDRRPVSAADNLVVITCPDPPGAEDCMRLMRQLGEQEEAEGLEGRPVVLFNQRLSSGDVGLGLNARRIRENFLKQFVITYSLRPIGEVGSVFRRYPGQWKVFLEEPSMPGRYKLIKETPSRPQGQQLDYMIQQELAPGGADPAQPDQQPGLMSQLGTTLRSVSRFMNSLSK